MKKYLSVFSITAMFLLLVSSTGFALNITISDKNISETDWHDGTNKGNEDQEVEPGMQHGQDWDLEAFLLEGTELSIVSGYDLKNGYNNLAPGDIFIDINGDALFGSNSIHDNPIDNDSEITNTFGYDYAIVTDFTTSSYKVYLLDADSKTHTPKEVKNQGSNPWKYVSGGTEITSGSFSFQENLTDSYFDNNFSGGKHYLLSGIDLGFIAGQEFTAHYTMQCGNDNLMGQGTVPTPEPSSVILLGLGICAFFGYRKRQAGLMK